MEGRGDCPASTDAERLGGVHIQAWTLGRGLWGQVHLSLGTKPAARGKVSPSLGAGNPYQDGPSAQFSLCGS